ncbi:MAG: putative 4-mercaptohistidine N1-methyltransferase [Verrucomicrobia bacterium]|nr:putative 4-mercaptohistidine N1-methyltransferase [Verrucomicrobiota bacterium]
MNPYESQRLLDEYLLFHYGAAEEVLPWAEGPRGALGFAQRVVSETLVVEELPKDARALDLGCAVGRSSFELARNCAEVVGIDFSASFVRAAEALRTGGELAYERADEGLLRTPLRARRPAGVEAARVRFEVGDACDLRADLGSFEVVLMANLIDRLPDPARCLARLPELVRAGGQLIIASPYTWLEEYTPRERWLGGRQDDAGSPRRTLDALRDALAPHFEERGTRDLPFLIREHARKYQWSVSQASLWRRRD